MLDRGLNPKNVTFHIEAVYERADELCRWIAEQGIEVGIALNPDTEVSKVESLIELADMILVMTVVPGKSGQAFRADQLPKIERIAQMIKDQGRAGQTGIQVDGGITEATARKVAEVMPEEVDLFLAAASYIIGEGVLTSEYESRVMMLRRVRESKGK